MTTITKAEAEARGYWPVTFKIELPREKDLVESILSNFKGTGHSAVLVQQDCGVSVWRDGRQADYREMAKTIPGGANPRNLRQGRKY